MEIMNYLVELMLISIIHSVCFTLCSAEDRFRGPNTVLRNFAEFQALTDVDSSDYNLRLNSEGRYARDSGVQSEEEDELKIKQIQPESKSSNDKPSKHDIELPEGYSKYEIPKDLAGNPIPVYVHVQVINILEIDELDEILHFDIEFSVRWTDYNILYFNNQNATNMEDLLTIKNMTDHEIKAARKTLNNPFILDKIWKPNLFIENLLSVKQPAVMSPPVTVKVIKHVGWLEYITRISMKMDCEMDMHYYPADTQECDFSIRGFSYAQKDLNLQWYKNGVFLDDISLPSFDVRIDWTDKLNWSMSKNSFGASENVDSEFFDVLRFRISSRRKLSYHIVQTYLASTFYIVITTLCFLLPSRMIEARIGISMTTLLTLTAMFASVRESTPVVSYVKAIDTWMVGCVFFVFLVLAQFTFHTWVKGEPGDEKDKSQEKSVNASTAELETLQKKGIELDDMRKDGVAGRTRHDSTATDVKFNSGPSKLIRFANSTERYSFPFFLTLFAFYTTIYWSWLLTSADYFDWDVNATLNNVPPEDA